MSQMGDEIDEIHNALDLLANHLNVHFERDQGEMVLVANKATTEPEPAYTPSKKSRFIDFKEIDAKLREKNTVDEVNEYEREIMALDLTENQKMAIREKVIDRRGVLLYKERHNFR